MTELKLGGVPEHFNLPWHIANEEGVFEGLDLEFTFTDFPGGTGAMIEGLKNQEIDLALLLTEGAVKFIAENPEYKIIKVYVDSPLLWGVHLPANADSSDLINYPFAISRYGSGSHLMAYVYAQNNGWNTKSLNFEVIKNLSGLREFYKENKEALFLWEKFTTKPFVDNGEMQRVDVCPTPWPCFVLVAHQKFISENEEALENLLDGINMCLDTFKERPEIENEIADAYELQLSDVNEWFAQTDWNSSNEVSKKMLEKVSATLLDLEIISTELNPQSMISSLSLLVD